MGLPLQILIKSESNIGLTEIMSGYLRFYGNKRIQVIVAGKQRVIHPLAEQVLLEDGIEYVAAGKAIAGNPDITIHINSATTSALKSSGDHKFFQFTNPMQSSDYDETLAAYRLVREEIKTACINIVGELQLA